MSGRGQRQTIINSGTIIGTSAVAIQFAGGDDLLPFQAGKSCDHRVVDGGSGINTLEFTSSATTGTLTGSGAVFDNFASATIDAGASWVFAGTNTLGSSVALVDAGTLTNIGTLVADPPLTVTGTFINSSIVSAPAYETAIYIASGGVVTNTGAGTITAGDGITASGTVGITILARSRPAITAST